MPDHSKNDQQRKKAHACLDHLLDANLGKPFHGVLQVSVHVQDGTVNHIKTHSEQTHK